MPDRSGSMRPWSAAWERLIAVSARDGEEVRLGRLFNILMVISTGIVVSLSAIFLLMPPLGLLDARVSWIAAAFPLAFIPLSLFCLAQARRGHVRPMVLLYVWVNLVAIAAAAWLFDGIHSPAWPLFIWTITVAGVLLAPSYALWMTGGVVVYFLSLLLATRWGLYSPSLSFGTAGREFAHMSALLIMLVSTVGLLTYLNMRSLREALQHLRQSEDRFRGIFEHVGDIIYTIEADGTFSSISPSSERMLGWRPDEWLGRPFALIVHPDDLPYMQELFAKAQKGESLPVSQVRILTKTGGYLEAEIAANPVHRGDSIVILGVARDITERKRLEEAVRRLNEELEAKVEERTRQLVEAQDELVRREKLAVLGQVADTVGHELRNPLGVINNAAYFLQTVLSEADATTREYLGIIKDETANAERIVSDLLDAVRTKPPRPAMVNVAEVIGQTLGKCAIPASVSVSLDIPAALPAIRVDPMHLHQVLWNLVTNAVEAMLQGGALQVRVTEEPQALRISVEDSGGGMTPEQQARLFQPLFTTKARRVGLGLVVVKNLTQANGGSVTVTSEAGRGSVFTVTLPSGS